MNADKNRRVGSGFTLVELLVVISIIALLIAILLPSLKKAREQAKITRCGSQLHDIALSLMSYSTDYFRFPPQNSIGSSPESPVSQDERVAAGFWGYSVHETLASYMGGMQQSKAQDADFKQDKSKTHDVFYCPFAPPEKMIQRYNSSEPESLANFISGPGTGRGTTTCRQDYIHISYNYYGGLHEVANYPYSEESINNVKMDPMLTDKERNHILKKREMTRYRDAHSQKILMADTVMYWGVGEWRINHGVGWGVSMTSANFAPPKLDGANDLFGDGHVNWKDSGNFFELLDLPSGGGGRFKMAKTASMAQGQSISWW